MDISTILTQKGREQLVIGGFAFVKDRRGNGKTYWKCEEYKRKKNGIQGFCPATAHTFTDETIPPYHNNNHNHSPDLARAKIVLNDLKLKATTTTTNPREILQEISQNLTPAILGALPTPELMTRTGQRARKEENYPIANPVSLEELVIPHQYTVIKKENEEIPFLMYDSGPESGANRILVFCTPRDLQHLQDSAHWYVDGTFKVTPPLYQVRGQLYSIHGLRHGRCIPLVYCLLPSKTEDVYLTILQQLKQLQPNLNPTSISMDFEQGAINAFTQEFPGSRNHGCFFHYGQCLWRKIQSFPDVLHQYNNDADFQLQMKYFMALALVPPPHVVNAYTQIVGWPFFGRNPSLVPFLDYFEKTWIGELDRRGRRKDPLFPIELWNQYQPTINGEAKTNNYVEGWHRAFSSSVGASHPTLWKFIDCLKKEQGLVDLKMVQGNAGQLAPLGRRVYRDCAARILNCVRAFPEQPRNFEEYLQGCAINLSFGE